MFRKKGVCRYSINNTDQVNVIKPVNGKFRTPKDSCNIKL